MNHFNCRCRSCLLLLLLLQLNYHHLLWLYIYNHKMSNMVYLLTMVIASSLNYSSPPPRLIPDGSFLFFHHLNGYDTDYKVDTLSLTLLHFLCFISFHFLYYCSIVLLEIPIKRSKWKTNEYGLTYAVLLWGGIICSFFHFSSSY